MHWGLVAGPYREKTVENSVQKVKIDSETADKVYMTETTRKAGESDEDGTADKAGNLGRLGKADPDMAENGKIGKTADIMIQLS